MAAVLLYRSRERVPRHAPVDLRRGSQSASTSWEVSAADFMSEYPATE
jgi:hypothetical protein